MIKALDPTAQIAMAPVTEVTPLRLRYLNTVLTTYRARYGVSLPVDVWTVHVYMLPEIDRRQWAEGSESGTMAGGDTAWGIGEPVGLAVGAGETVHVTLGMVQPELLRI